MKKFFFFAIAALGMMVGCQKQEINNVQNPIDDSDRVAVQFSIDAPSLTITKTKGIGAVEEWSAQNLYILGFERSATSYALDEATTLIPNVVAAAPASEMEGEITVVHPEGDKNGDLSIAGEPYYYEDTKVYDFYGYYVDDANTNGTAATSYDGTTASIALKIDGTQDVMAAKADPGLDVVAGVAERNAYSSYAARRGVHPTLTFEHMLTRFNFHAVAGAKSGTKVTVESVTLDSYTDVTLTVAPTPALTVNADAKKSALTLDDVTSAAPYPEDPAEDFDYTYDYATLLTSEDAKIGSSIMAVAGETQHSVVLTTKLQNSNQSIPALTIPLNASDIVTADGTPVESFEAGYQYDIILTVYGPEEVKITAVLSDWKEGGNTVVDPDKWMEEDTEPAATVSAVSASATTFVVKVPSDATVVEAAYTAAGVATDDQTEWTPATQVKSLSDWTVSVSVADGKSYDLHVRHGKKETVKETVDGEETEVEKTVYSTKEIVVPFVAGSNIQNLMLGYVHDEDSYNAVMWDKYLVDNPYNKVKDQITDFPWLVIRLQEIPAEDVETYTISVTKDGEPFAFASNCVVEGLWTLNTDGTVMTVTSGVKTTLGVTFSADCFAANEIAAGSYELTVAYDGNEYTATAVVE